MREIGSMDSPSERRRARGFALYVGLSEDSAREHGLELAELVQALRQDIQKRAPGAGTHATAVLALWPSNMPWI